MKKKRRVPERSALDSARAALERAGEDPSAIPPEKPADDAKPSVTLGKPEAAQNAEAPEVAENAEASAPVDNAGKPETVEASESERPEAVKTSGPEAADSAEASAPVDNAEVSEPETPENAKQSAPETAESVQAFAPVDNAEASAPEAPENAEASKPESVPEPETPGPESVAPSDTSAPETAESADAVPPQSDAQASGIPPTDAQAVELPPTEAQASGEEPLFDASDMFPDEYEDEDDGEPETDFAETERHTMETKEFTVGYHRQRTESAEPVRDGKKRGTKSRFKALDNLKDAIRGRADAGEEGDDDPQSGSPRDAAIRKRVMQIEDDETRNYLLDRLLPQMTWYSRRSAQYRTMYYRLMAATIFLGALIPVFSVGGSYGAVKVIIALLGASVTAINAYIALHNYHDLWITYQKTREDLIHTLYCYFNNAGVFSQKKLPQKDLNVLLVDICEDTLSKENGGWTTIVQKT